VDELITGTPQPSEVVDARGGFPVLSGRLNDLSSSLAQSAKKLTGIVNIMEYENLKVTVANGYDWQPVIQTAINSLNGKGTVVVPVGIFEVYSPINIPNNVSLLGQSFGAWDIIKCGLASEIYNASSTGTDAIIFTESGYGSTLQDLKITGSVTSGNGVSFGKRASGVNIVRCNVLRNGKSGIRFNFGAMNIKMIGGQIARNFSHGLEFLNNVAVGDVDGDTNGIRVTMVDINRNSGSGIHLVGSGSSNNFYMCDFTLNNKGVYFERLTSGRVLRNSRIIGCWFEDNSTAIHLKGGTNSVDTFLAPVVKDCHIADSTTRGMHLENIQNGVFEDIFMLNNVTQIEIVTPSRNNEFNRVIRTGHTTDIVDGGVNTYLDGFDFTLGKLRTKGIVRTNQGIDFQGSKAYSMAIDSGTTRPTSPTLGQIFYDRTLYKPIWFNGSSWTDSSGTVV
jgi:hypothetical protein